MLGEFLDHFVGGLDHGEDALLRVPLLILGLRVLFDFDYLGGYFADLRLDLAQCAPLFAHQLGNFVQNACVVGLGCCARGCRHGGLRGGRG